MGVTAGRRRTEPQAVTRWLFAEGLEAARDGVALPAAASPAPDRADVVVVPTGPRQGAGGSAEEQLPAILGRAPTTEIPKLLAAAPAAEGTTVATGCGGSPVLSMAGLLHGRHTTTHHQGLDLLYSGGAHVVPGRIVADGDLVTVGGAEQPAMTKVLLILHGACGARSGPSRRPFGRKSGG